MVLMKTTRRQGAETREKRAARQHLSRATDPFPFPGRPKPLLEAPGSPRANIEHREASRQSAAKTMSTPGPATTHEDWAPQIPTTMQGCVVTAMART